MLARSLPGSALALLTTNQRRISSIAITLFDVDEIADWSVVRINRSLPKFKHDEDHAHSVFDPLLGKEPGGFHTNTPCCPTCGFAWRR